MLGVVASIVGELFTGKGALAQLGYEFHESLLDVEGEIAFVILLMLAGALLPTGGAKKFVPSAADLDERPAGALQDASISLATPSKFFGISGFGFNKANELFVGRMAQLGFAASLIGEALTGKVRTPARGGGGRAARAPSPDQASLARPPCTHPAPPPPPRTPTTHPPTGLPRPAGPGVWPQPGPDRGAARLLCAVHPGCCRQPPAC